MKYKQLEYAVLAGRISFLSGEKNIPGENYNMLELIKSRKEMMHTPKAEASTIELAAFFSQGWESQKEKSIDTKILTKALNSLPDTKEFIDLISSLIKTSNYLTTQQISLALEKTIDNKEFEDLINLVDGTFKIKLDFNLIPKKDMNFNEGLKSKEEIIKVISFGKYEYLGVIINLSEAKFPKNHPMKIHSIKSNYFKWALYTIIESIATDKKHFLLKGVTGYKKRKVKNVKNL